MRTLYSLRSCSGPNLVQHKPKLIKHKTVIRPTHRHVWMRHFELGVFWRRGLRQCQSWAKTRMRYCILLNQSTTVRWAAHLEWTSNVRVMRMRKLIKGRIMAVRGPVRGCCIILGMRTREAAAGDWNHRKERFQGSVLETKIDMIFFSFSGQVPRMCFIFPWRGSGDFRQIHLGVVRLTDLIVATLQRCFKWCSRYL